MGAGGSIAGFDALETVSICDKHDKKLNDTKRKCGLLKKNQLLEIDSDITEKSYLSDLNDKFSPEIVLRINYFEKMCFENGMSPKETTLSTSQKFNHHLEASFLDMVEPRPVSISRMTLSPKPSMIQTNLCPFWPPSPQSVKTKMTRSPSSVTDFL
jgi:hypothetical protein